MTTETCRRCKLSPPGACWAQTEFPSGCGAASPSQGPWDPPALQPPPIRARGQGSQSPTGGSMKEGARPRRGLRVPEGARAGTGKRPSGLLLGSVRAWAQPAGPRGPQSLRLSPRRPSGPRPRARPQSQVQLVGLDALELLAELQEGGPRGGVQVPAVLHDLVDCRRAAVGGIHLVALLHPRDDVLQGLRGGGGGVSRCEA